MKDDTEQQDTQKKDQAQYDEAIEQLRSTDNMHQLGTVIKTIDNDIVFSNELIKAQLLNRIRRLFKIRTHGTISVSDLKATMPNWYPPKKLCQCKQ